MSETKTPPKTTSALDLLPAEAIAAVRAAPLLANPVDRVDQAEAVVPSKRIGSPIPPEGSDGLFSQSWFPICLASDVANGAVKGYDFLDGRVVVWRGRDGVARVMSAFCPHMGASLEAGAVVGDHLRCGFHHWEYAGNGVCAKTAIGDAAPAHACLFVFPSLERWGIVWAFNGETPLFDVPSFPFPTETLLAKTIELPHADAGRSVGAVREHARHPAHQDAASREVRQRSVRSGALGQLLDAVRVRRLLRLRRAREMARRHLGHVVVLPERVSRRPLVRLHGADGHAAARVSRGTSW